MRNCYTMNIFFSILLNLVKLIYYNKLHLPGHCRGGQIGAEIILLLRLGATKHHLVALLYSGNVHAGFRRLSSNRCKVTLPASWPTDG